MTDPSRSGRALVVDDDGLELPEELEPDRTYDVVLNGQHVWSLQPAKVKRVSKGSATARWPDTLRPFLRGRAEVVLRDHVDGTTVASREHVFADEPGLEVSVRDKHGNALVLDKYLRLTKPLAAAGDATTTQLMDQLEELLRALQEDAGLPAFVCYGTLLGAVRDGSFIGHDNDIDIAYLSPHTSPVDVVRESFRVERVLRRRGWVVRRGSGARLNVRLFMDDGTIRFVDVFTACWVEGVLYMQSDTGFRLPESAVLPLGSVPLMDREVPAPADPEALLAATYGPRWRTPDPSFQYSTPEWLARRLQGWFGGLAGHRKAWDTFYKTGGTGRQVPLEPSRFAEWVSTHHPSQRPLVDLGTGNGRDAVHFAQHRPVRAVDYSMGVLARSRRRTARSGLPLTFETLNLYDGREVLAFGTRLSREPEPVDLYARFLLHALNTDGEELLWRLARLSLRRGGHLFLEFRTPRDARRKHHFGERFRRYRSCDDVVAAVESHGGHVVHREQGRGLAPLENEDPVVARVVARWSAAD